MFRERLKRARDNKQLTQVQLGVAATRFLPDDTEQITDEQIKDWEAGKCAPSDDQLEALAKALFKAPAEANEFILAGKIARKPKLRERQKQLNAMLYAAAMMVSGGRPRIRRTPLQRVFSQEALSLSRATIPEVPDVGAGPKMQLDAWNLNGNAIDFRIRNIGARPARDLVLLMPGPIFNRCSQEIAAEDTVELTLPLTENAESLFSDALLEYADDSSNPILYVQRLNRPETERVQVLARCLERLKTWYDVNSFIVDRLGGEPFRMGISARHLPIQIDADPGAARVMKDLEPSAEYAAAGFRKYAPEGMYEQNLPEAALMSPDLNRILWDSGKIRATDSKSETLRSRLEEHMVSRQELPDVLRHKYASLGDGQLFFNEDKVCLGGDILSTADVAPLFRGTYFHGYLTNEQVTRRVCTRGEHPAPVFCGSDSAVYSNENGLPRLGSIADSMLSNHIGASVLLFTSDHRIQYWRQSRGEQGVGKLAATGSGSCDWGDWTAVHDDDATLTGTVKRAMRRELREESGMLGSAIRDRTIDTRVLGYFRWIRRGGKPEFVGLAKAEVPSTELRPDVTEVDAPTGVARNLAYFIDAQDIDTLKCGIDAFLDQHVSECSLPLWVGLTCLRALCEDDREAVTSFLWGTEAFRPTVAL